MKQCQFCKAMFANEDAYQIFHLGVAAPAFHTCNDASEMTAKGHDAEPGRRLGAIDEKLIEHQSGWAYLKPQESEA